ncbi:hypothetical protein [Streptomyces heilongjiangensis]|uniref:Uncharacterized protein n=1 Tax=Streptomyces heilongjiangensis TaxID=945052 RepID=A0ABW1B465_9ACTN|nr:hypothetical protein [Streptomyces heilongjiangensis]MDC2948387.1 hypothetical protein [Streptomyces heilongjiangensis]
MTEHTTTGDGDTRGRREQRPAATGTAYTTGANRTSGPGVTKGTMDPNRTTGPDDTTGTPGPGHTTVPGHTPGPAHTPGPGGTSAPAPAPATGTGTPGPADSKGATGSRDTRDTRSPLVAGHEGEGRAEGRASGASAGHLLPNEETDKLSLRLQHAVGGFVDGPRSAVEEADHVLEEAASRFTDAVNQRRRTLRATWESGGGERGSSADTEQLRLALRDYRELTERLLRL